MTILAVTGMTKEAEIVGIEGVVAVAGGGDAVALAQKLEALHGDIKGVISIGLAGGLSPHLKVGDVVIADRVIAGEADFKCDALWRVRLAARLAHAHQGHVAANSIILDSARAKAALFEKTGALAVDMESHVAARFADARGLPFAVLRVISDSAAHTLPPAALVAMKPDGSIAIGKVLGSLLRHPLQLPGLIRTARMSGRAFAELLRCRDLCGAGLCGVGAAGLDG